MTVMYALFNLAITAGYIFVGVTVAPSFDLKRNWAKVGGIVFFITCGLTHLEMAFYALSSQVAHSAHLGISFFSFANHFIQVIAVWTFVVGLYLEYVADKKSLNVTLKKE